MNVSLHRRGGIGGGALRSQALGRVAGKQGVRKGRAERPLASPMWHIGSAEARPQFTRKNIVVGSVEIEVFELDPIWWDGQVATLVYGDVKVQYSCDDPTAFWRNKWL